jgi:orotidine-5'-phosphate decarboxylase
MMRAAVNGLSNGSDGDAGVLAVTVLTSLDGAALAATGVANDIDTHVGILAALAAESGAEGVVCSVRELGVVRAVAPRLTKVTPGVRPTGSAPGDQARVATPAEAVAAGADLLVIGRPITRADDPAAAAAAIQAGLTQPF